MSEVRLCQAQISLDRRSHLLPSSVRIDATGRKVGYDHAKIRPTAKPESEVLSKPDSSDRAPRAFRTIIGDDHESKPRRHVVWLGRDLLKAALLHEPNPFIELGFVKSFRKGEKEILMRVCFPQLCAFDQHILLTKRMKFSKAGK